MLIRTDNWKFLDFFLSEEENNKNTLSDLKATNYISSTLAGSVETQPLQQQLVCNLGLLDWQRDSPIWTELQDYN